jgi:hypothetical protein
MGGAESNPSGQTQRISTKLYAELADVQRWHGWKASVGLQTRAYPAIDIDVDDEATAAAIEGEFKRIFGAAPVRFREGSSRRLMLTRIADGEMSFRKRRLAFMVAGNKAAVELLGAGQQCVVEGPHPKGGHYQWRDGHPCQCKPQGLPEITKVKADEFFAAVADYCEMMGYEIVAKTNADAGAGTRQSLDNPALHAPSPELVLAAMKVWRPDEMGHDEYVQAVRGLKASFGPRREEFKDEVLEWSPGVRSTEDDQFEIRCNSIRDSALGWSWVAAQARKYGFTEDAQTDFDDELPKEWIGENNTAPKAEPTKTPCIIAKLYTWTDPCTIAPRPWVYDRHFIRNFLSGTFAPGGLGKSSLLIAEALAMATGKNLLGVLPKTQLRVWYWNGEDPWDELQRRIAAACSHYHVNATDLGDRLFVSSGRDTEIVIAYDDRGGTRVATPVVEALCTEIRAKRIDVLILDPFVALHGVSENDNNKINAVCRHFAMVAEKTGCAIELVHHVRKRAPIKVSIRWTMLAGPARCLRQCGLPERSTR